MNLGVKTDEHGHEFAIGQNKPAFNVLASSSDLDRLECDNGQPDRSAARSIHATAIANRAPLRTVPAGGAQKEVARVEIGNPLQGWPVQYFYFLAARRDQTFTPKLLERPVHVHGGQSHRVRHMDLRDLATRSFRRWPGRPSEGGSSFRKRDAKVARRPSGDPG